MFMQYLPTKNNQSLLNKILTLDVLPASVRDSVLNSLNAHLRPGPPGQSSDGRGRDDRG